MTTLLITDLDNTLYDWVTFFARSFAAMVDALVDELGFDRDDVLDEFRAVHRQLGDSEQPFALLELPCIRERFGHLDRLALKHQLDGPLRAFNTERKRQLKLYASVSETLAKLEDSGVIIVGHTEAIKANAYYRLGKLGIASHFRRLYVLESSYCGHPDPGRAAELRPPDDIIHVLSRSRRKPNPEVLLEICRGEGVTTGEAFYVGDSLTRDIGMAEAAGVTAIWARYGTVYDPRLWETLVRVSHWTDLDIQREAELKQRQGSVQPDYTIDSFGELVSVLGIEREPVSAARARAL
jgi:FMN phosphatase YigB (HAD superfamily)